MDAFDTQSRNSWSFSSLASFHQISPLIQTHLKKVYLTLCCALVACLCYMVWLLLTPPIEEQNRVVLPMTFALRLQGASISPLSIELKIGFGLSNLIAASGGTALAFGCFSAAAILSRRREYIYLGGLLSSGLSVLLWLRFASMIFGGSSAFFSSKFCLGLMVLLGYLMFDAQAIVERVYHCDLGYAKHSLAHFTNVIAAFLKNSLEKIKMKERQD